MILYNITYNIDRVTDGEWKTWLKETYLPRVMSTGCFRSYKVYRMLNEEDDHSINYAVQFLSDSLVELNDYLQSYAPSIAAELQMKFRHRHVAFMSVLQDTGL